LILTIEANFDERQQFLLLLKQTAPKTRIHDDKTNAQKKHIKSKDKKTCPERDRSENKRGRGKKGRQK
jgi:hypothetical protein